MQLPCIDDLDIPRIFASVILCGIKTGQCTEAFCFRTEQRGENNPLTRRVDALRNRCRERILYVREKTLHRTSQLIAVRHDQTLLCTGHSYIQDTQLFRFCLNQNAIGNSGSGDGRVTIAFILFYQLYTDAESRVQERGALDVTGIKPTRQISKEYDRKLKSFAGVDRHDSHSFVFQNASRCLRKLFALVNKRLDMAQKTKEASCTAHLKRADHFAKLTDVGHALFAVTKRTKDILCISLEKQLCEQIAQFAVRSHAAKSCQLGKKHLALVIVSQTGRSRVLYQSVVETGSLFLVNDLKISVQRLNLSGVHDGLVARRLACNTEVSQSLDVMRRRVFGGTHQNNDIVCGDRSHLMRIFVHDRVFTKHFLNALSNILCFDIDLGRTAGLRSVIVRGALSCDIFHVDRYEFYCVSRDLFILWEIGSAGSQCFLFVVVDTANYRAHAAMHDVIGCFEDFRARTKVLAEKNLARLPFSCLCVILVGVVMRQED